MPEAVYGRISGTFAGRNFKLFFILGVTPWLLASMWGMTGYTHPRHPKTLPGAEWSEWSPVYFRDNNKEIWVWNPTCWSMQDYVDAVRGLDVRDAGGAVKVNILGPD